MSLGSYYEFYPSQNEKYHRSQLSAWDSNIMALTSQNHHDGEAELHNFGGNPSLSSQAAYTTDTTPAFPANRHMSLHLEALQSQAQPRHSQLSHTIYPNNLGLFDTPWSNSSAHDVASSFPTTARVQDANQKIANSMTCPRSFPHPAGFPAKRDASTIGSAEDDPMDYRRRCSGIVHDSEYDLLGYNAEKLSNLDTFNTSPTGGSFHSSVPSPTKSSAVSTSLAPSSPMTPNTTDVFTRDDEYEAINGNETEGEGGTSSEPYAQLIYRAMSTAPNHSMVLRDIYEWFKKNTDKGKDGDSRGWQNSIRHNLSMNGAFRKVDQADSIHPDGSKKGFIWVLDRSAIEAGGVQSTTRFRKPQNGQKPNKTERPTSQRQRSGTKGCNTSKESGRAKRHTRNSKFSTVEVPYTASPNEKEPQDSFDASPAFEYLDHSLNDSSSDAKPLPDWIYEHPSQLSYTINDIAGCAPNLENSPFFYNDLGNNLTGSANYTAVGRPIYYADSGVEFSPPLK